MADDITPPASHPPPPASEWRCGRACRVVLGALAGLVLTPILVFLMGWVVYGQRTSWNWGQGESFIVFLLAIYAAPIGALYGAAVAFLASSRPRWLWLAGVLYLLGLLGTVIAIIGAYA